MIFGFPFFDETTLTQILLLALSFVLSAVIGLERQRRMKSAGLRTHVLVGIGSTVFTLVSAYGFAHVIGNDVVLDPSRIAAQIVSGIGFLGAGLIFVRNKTVNGLTTAASVWVTAAIGMASGAGMPVIAIVSTLFYLLTVTLLMRLGRWLSRRNQRGICVVEYEDGMGVLRDVLAQAADMGFDVQLEGTEVMTRKNRNNRVEARLRFRGKGPVHQLLDEIADLNGVTNVGMIGDRDRD